MRKLKTWLNAGLAALVLMLVVTAISYTAVQQIAGLSVAATATKWNSVKDFGVIGDGATSGMLAAGLMFNNGTNMDRATGTTANGLDVDVTRIQGGTATPSDTFTNPTTAITTWGLEGIWNQTTSQWERARAALAAAAHTTYFTTGVPASGLYGFDRLGTTTGYRAVSMYGLSIGVHDLYRSTVNITTATDTFINKSPGLNINFGKIIVGVGVAASTVILYTEPDGSAPCGGAGSAIIGTYSTANPIVYDLTFLTSNSMCLTTSHATNLTVVYETELD